MNNQRILEQLKDAESALRENLHRHDFEPTARAHMERALNHVRESYIATNEVGKARTVHQLVSDCEGVERLMIKINRGHKPGVVTIKPSH